MTFSFQRIAANKLTLILVILAFVYLLLRAIAVYQYESIPFEGNYFNYEGKNVGYTCKGNGEPLVFFESGFGSDSEETWSAIVQELPETYTACYYDRLGHGGSDDVPLTFTTDEKSQLQESLIKHIAGDTPVIIVAKSYGGIIARKTVARANINLTALIFLDSAHENQHEIMRGKFDPIPEYVKVLQYVNAALGLTDIKNVFKTYDSPISKRLDQYYSSFRWAHVLSTYRNEKGFYTPLKNYNYDFGDLRMLVLSHDSEAYAESPRFSQLANYWPDMQKSIAALSNNSEHIIVKGATHNIPADAPEVVVAKIMETVEFVSSQASNNVSNAPINDNS